MLRSAREIVTVPSSMAVRCTSPNERAGTWGSSGFSALFDDAAVFHCRVSVRSRDRL